MGPIFVAMATTFALGESNRLPACIFYFVILCAICTVSIHCMHHALGPRPYTVAVLVDHLGPSVFIKLIDYLIVLTS